MGELNEIGDAFARALEKMFDERPGLTVKAAAQELRVSRQSLHSYLNGVLPRRKTLHRAVHMWKLKLDLGRYSFGEGAFGSAPQDDSTSVAPPQPTLWAALDAIKERDLHVAIKRVGKVLRLAVKIEISA